jgi:hypothetical protein
MVALVGWLLGGRRRRPRRSIGLSTPASASRRAAFAAVALPALLFVAVGLRGQIDRGPIWMGLNADPSYVYLFSSLALAVGEVPGHADHPGAPVQRLGELALRCTTPGETAALLASHCDPRRAARLLESLVRSEIVCGAIVLLAALSLLARHARPWAVFLAGLGPSLTATSASQLPYFKPEGLLAPLAVLVGALSWLIEREDRRKRSQSVLLGIAAGSAVATKWTALLLVVPLLLALPRVRAQWRLWGPAALFSFGAWAFHLRNQIPASIAFAWRSAVGNGRYGRAAYGAVDLGRWCKRVGELLGGDPLLAIAVVAAGLALARLARGREGSETYKFGAVLVATQALAIMVVAKQPEARYLVPVAALAGFDLAVAFTALEHWRGPELSLGLRLRTLLTLCVLLATVAGWMEVENAWRTQLRSASRASELARGIGREVVVVEGYDSSTPEYALWLGYHQLPSESRISIASSARSPIILNFWDHRLETFDGAVSPADERLEAPLVFRGRIPRDPSRLRDLLATLKSYGVVSPGATHLVLPRAGARGECLYTLTRSGVILLFAEPAEPGKAVTR